MSFGDVAAAAIRFADEGFPMYPLLADKIAVRRTCALAFQRRRSSAGRQPAQGGRPLRAEGPRRARCVTWRTREAGRPRGRAAGLRRPATRSTAAISPADRGFLRRGRIPVGGGSRRVTIAGRSGPRCARRTRCVHLRPVVPGAGAAALHCSRLRPQGARPQQCRLPPHVAEALKLAFADREAYYGDPASRRAAGRPVSPEYGAARGR